MECVYNKLLNSLIEICVVVGIDQDTGLTPTSPVEMKEISDGKREGSPLFTAMFEASVLAALSGQTASFPFAPPDVDGRPFYPTSAVFGSPSNRATLRRRRGSIKVKNVELPLAQDVIFSLPPLCFPDGCFVSKKKKPAVCHSLVLTDIEGNRTYCSCVTFYRGFIAKEVKDIPGNYQLIYLDEKNDKIALQDSSYVTCYVPTCCCLISKWPYFNLLKDCLSSLLLQLSDCCDSYKFRRTVMQFVSHLAMVPVPPSGSLALEFELYEVKHIIRPAEDPDTRVVDMELHYPFLYFSLDNILFLMGCILTQQRIVFLSSTFSLLTPIIESLFTFIQPFTWSWTYVPVLPSALVDLVEAPGAFIMGCHSKHKDQIRRVVTEMDELSTIVIADIDEGTVKPHPNARIPGLPTYVTDMFKFRLKNAPIHFDRLLVQRQTFYSLEELQKEREKFVKDFRLLILASTLEMMLRMFSDIKTHIVQQEDLFFDMDAFIDSKPLEDKEFYLEVCKSHAFSMFLHDLMHDPQKTDYFTLMAQKTRIKPKAGPLRKRSSSSSAVPVMISQEYFATQQESLSILTLPPFDEQGMYTGSFYTKCLKTLDEKIESLMKKSSSLLANYLYLRGMFWIACGQNVKAVDDFFGVSSRNVQLFPNKTVREIVCKLKNDELEELRTRHFWRKAEHLMLQVTEKGGFRHERKEVVTSAIPSCPLDLDEFVKHVSMLQIANSQEAGRLLFGALTMNTRKEVVEPETFGSFYEVFNQASIEANSVTLNNVSLHENEYVLKISQLVRTDLGMGWLILTVDRLLFLADGNHKCSSLFSINHIDRVETLSCGVLLAITALKITTKLKEKAPFFAFLKEDREFWRNCLLEIQAGHQIAEETKDSLVIKQAAQNVIVADTLRRCDFSELTSSKPLYFSRQGDSRKLSNDTRQALVKRVSPSPQDVEKTTVEALLYVSGSADGEPKVWCAMGSGLVVVIDVETWEFESHMKHAKDRVSCLVAVGKHQVWAGSLDSTIYVINTHTKKADQQLLDHRDCITHMVKTADDEGHVTVWSASLNGQIVGWDPDTLTAKTQLQLNLQHKEEKTLYSFEKVGQHFWCATRFSIHVISYDESNSEPRVLTTKQDSQTSIDCMCVVSSNEVWTACDRRGLLAIWNTHTYTNRLVTFQEADGFTNMILIDGKVWAGSRSGAVYVLDTDTCQVEKKLELHKDRVRSMCLTDHGLVLTGPGSRDGQIAVWMSHLACGAGREMKAKVDAAITERENCVDGFQIVAKKDVVKFALDQNEIHYIGKRK